VTLRYDLILKKLNISMVKGGSLDNMMYNVEYINVECKYY
jgi:hypothetical protein